MDKRDARRGSAWVKALALGMAAVVLVVTVVVLVQESGRGGGNPYGALRGRWVRGEDPYVLEIRSAAADGTLEAGYFNPSPIRVARATASRDGKGATQVFVLLDDPVNPGYRGCTYDLVYDPQQDLLVGTYFQAVQGQRYEIAFNRMK
jgi:hypothetical protein